MAFCRPAITALQTGLGWLRNLSYIGKFAYETRRLFWSEKNRHPWQSSVIFYLRAIFWMYILNFFSKF